MAGKLIACTTVWWKQSATKYNLEQKKEDATGSLIICMNHGGDNDNEQASQQSPRRPFSHSHCCCVYEIHSQSDLSILSIRNDNKRISRGMHSNIDALTELPRPRKRAFATCLEKEKSVLLFVGY